VRDGAADKPAVMVSFFAAQRYCEGRGKRLPTEAEWEFIARGAERRTFPWGEAPPKCNGTVFGRGADLPEERRCTGPGMDHTASKVGTSLQDRTPDGVLDLGGNVAEWVQDAFVDRYAECGGGCENPIYNPDAQGEGGKNGKGKKAALLRVVRGGHFDLPADACRGAGRSRLAEDTLSTKLGFRCVRSIAK
jgi:formylglycine-generating enzyme required for sulfatase activity